jgi:hypothetical protein
VASAQLARGACGHDPLRAAAVRDGVLEWLRSGAGDGLLERRGRRAPGPARDGRHPPAVRTRWPEVEPAEA